MAAAQPSTSSSNTSEINVIQEMTDYYQSLVELFAKGVNFDLPGNGGPDCLEYLSETQRIYETILGLTVVVVAFGLGHKLHLDKPMRPKTWTPSTLRSILAVSMSFCIGMEFTYKLCTQQLLFIINPCHVMCFLQIIILNLNPFTDLAQDLFKLMICGLHFPLTACIFPVTNTLALPGEVFTFWLEHLLLLLIPIYLLLEKFLYVQNMFDFSYTLRFYAYYYIYNLLILQPICLVSMVNINNVLCPAIKDPFAGKYYRLHTLWHQLFFSVVIEKMFILLSKLSKLKSE